jgi:hypothetical protein
VGYARIFSSYKLDQKLLWRRSMLRADSRPRESHLEADQLVETFPAAYCPKREDDFDHLVFALKYDGVDPYALVQIFARIDRGELARRISAQPTSKYARRLCFLCERLTQTRLDVQDATQGEWCPALDPKRYFTAPGVRSARHRVTDNLLGDRAFCPTIRRTAALAASIARRLGDRAAEITRGVDPALLARATWYLYTKETKSSFAIEREQPGDRMERYVRQLATVGELPLDTIEGLIDLQNSLVHPTYAERAIRAAGELEVYVGETQGFHERVHHIGAPSAATPGLMDGWMRTREVEGEGGPVIEAACRSFAFIFIHPFGDGNGRIHRLLLHHVLARRGFTQDRLVVPISSVLLNNPRSYDEALEAFSAKVMETARYKLDGEGVLTLHDVDEELYRFPDLTVQAEATFGWLERAIEEELPAELDFLRQLDEIRERMREIIEMPDRKEQLFINVCRRNGGVLSARKRAKFPELDDEVVRALEAVIREVIA